MALLTTQQVVLRIAIIISFIELMIMVVLDNVPHPGIRLPDSVIDVVLLALISSPVIYRLVIRDYVTARDDALAEVTALALTDPLTRLANRRLLSSHLEKVISGSLRHKAQGALLLIDLDGFKRINDEFGHDAGDAVLIAVAERLTTTTRAEDMAARLGGDEFVVLIHCLDSDPKTTRLKAEQVAEKLIALIRQPIDHHGQPL
jgi:diguanylate cyclase (GGDEF)-like protein